MNKILIFAAGTIVGAIASWVYAKAKYEKIANDEINSVKEMYYMTKHGKSNTDQMKDIDRVNAEIKEAAKNLYRNYTDKYNRESENEEEKIEVDARKPYVISPEEFEDGEFATETITLYADGVLTDSWDEPMDIEMNVGKESLKHFGEYENDTVYVRNEEQEIDYEICRDERKYSDVHPEE